MIPLSIGLLAQDNSAEIQFDIDPDVAEAAAGAALGVGLMFVAIWLLVGLLVLVGIWKTFAKAGQPGWASIIPIYNMIVMLEIAGKPIWWFVLLLIPGLNLIAAILIYVSLAERFGKGAGFAIGLLVLPMVFFPMLGFGNAAYQGNASSENAVPETE